MKAQLLLLSLALGACSASQPEQKSNLDPKIYQGFFEKLSHEVERRKAQGRG